MTLGRRKVTYKFTISLKIFNMTSYIPYFRSFRKGTKVSWNSVLAQEKKKGGGKKRAKMVDRLRDIGTDFAVAICSRIDYAGSALEPAIRRRDSKVASCSLVRGNGHVGKERWEGDKVRRGSGREWKKGGYTGRGV